MTRTPVSADIAGQLVFLGTGTSMGVPMIGCDCSTCQSSDPRNHRTRCALALGLPEGNLLVDTPPDLRTQLLRENLALFHALFYTHAHADHLMGMDDLRLMPVYLGGPMPVFCEDHVEQRIRTTFDYAFDEYAARYPAGAVPKLDIRRTQPGESISLLGTTLTPFRLSHGRFLVLGFRVGNVAYCTDTNAIPEESLPELQGLDVLILDCLRRKPHPSHFCLDEAIAVAQSLAPRRTLFTHMSHDLDHETTNRWLPSGMELAHDGLRIPLT